MIPIHCFTDLPFICRPRVHQVAILRSNFLLNARLPFFAVFLVNT